MNLMKLVSALCIPVLAFGFSACKSAEKDKILVVSVEPQRALLEEIVGDRYKIVTMLTPGANPETFEPGMQSRMELDKAMVYFTAGYLPFEEKLKNSVDGSVKIVDTSKGIKPILGTHNHSHGHQHIHHHHTSRKERLSASNNKESADPHVWTSVKNAKIMAENMYLQMVDIDPDFADSYTVSYNRLVERLDSLDEVYASLLSEAGSPSFAIWHPSLSYFARDYGLEQIAVGFENKEMPPLVLRSVIDEAHKDSVTVFFFQKEYDSRQAETLNQELGTTLVTINPLAYEWQQQLDSIVSALCR